MNSTEDSPDKIKNPVLQPDDKTANQLDVFTPLLSQNKGDFFNIGKELLQAPKHLLQASVLGRVKEEETQLLTRMMFSHMNSSQGYVDPEQIITFALTLSIGRDGLARKEAVATNRGYGYGIPDGNSRFNPIKNIINQEKQQG
jgi:hypothetical protein